MKITSEYHSTVEAFLFDYQSRKFKSTYTHNYMSVYTIVYLQLYEYLCMLINMFFYVRTLIFVYILEIYLHLYEYFNFNILSAEDFDKIGITF